MTHSDIKQDYATLLKNAPPHDSDEFLIYLMNNNVVVKQTEHWLIIENCKYHTEEKPWWTAFLRDKTALSAWVFTSELVKIVPDGWSLMKKPADKQSIKRPHYHIVKV